MSESTQNNSNHGIEFLVNDLDRSTEFYYKLLIAALLFTLFSIFGTLFGFISFVLLLATLFQQHRINQINATSVEKLAELDALRSEISRLSDELKSQKEK